MPKGIRISFISVLAIISILVFETSAVGKKKPKRRSRRSAAAKKVNSLPRAFPILVQTLSTTRLRVEANVPMLQARPSLPGGSNPGETLATKPPETRRSVSVSLTTKGPKAPVLSGPRPNAAATAGQLIISEFRLRGPFGGNDQFVEIYNASGADHTVADSGAGTGYAIAAEDGVARCIIPNNVVIPNRGHYLCTNSINYSLSNYPSGNDGVNATTATGDATYTVAIPDNAGIALFNTSVAANFNAATRLDAVGSTSAAALYREGAGYPPLSGAAYTSGTDYSFYRDTCGKSGSVTVFGQCPITTPKDTEDNAADFIFVDTSAAAAGAGQRLGAPGPQNRTSPIQRNASFTAALLDPCVSNASPPNRARDLTDDIAEPNDTYGTLEIRRTLTNNTGGNVTRLRFRVIDITIFPAPSGIADLRLLSSTPISVLVDRAPCGTVTSLVTVQGTTLEEADPPPPPRSQPNGGGFNSSVSAATVTLNTPLANGASIDLRFLFAVQQTGKYKIWLNIEVLP
jgi:hypothetical protein